MESFKSYVILPTFAETLVDMKIFKTKVEISNFLSKLKAEGKKIAFVPTMGALHEGHLALLKKAKYTAEITVCSIFVNPTQFNDKEDLIKYPRPIEADIQKLENIECDVLFLPEVDEMYEQDEKWHLDLGILDEIWEGAMRPGHFQGVTQVVYKLFNIIKPDFAIFGQKDFQQCAVIQYMVHKLELPIKLIIHPIEREKDGLALSSRNVRLSENGRKTALQISATLFYMENLFKKGQNSLEEIKAKGLEKLEATEGLKVEYLAICEVNTLEEKFVQKSDEKYVILVVAWVDNVRLLDNLLLN